MEIKKKDNYVQEKCLEISYYQFVIVSTQGLSGGLVMMWKKSVAEFVNFKSPNLVDCEVQSNKISFYLSFVYGYPKPANRHKLWERL